MAEGMWYNTLGSISDMSRFLLKFHWYLDDLHGLNRSSCGSVATISCKESP